MEADWRSLHLDAGHRHSLAINGRSQIEVQLLDCVSPDVERTGHLAVNHVRTVADSEPEHVVHGVHTRLPRVGVSARGKCVEGTKTHDEKLARVPHKCPQYRSWRLCVRSEFVWL